MMTTLRRLSTLLVALGITLGSSAAHAGCGCDKPPPPLAAVRPFVTPVGYEITLFDPALQVGRGYRVEFRSAGGERDWSRGRARMARDLADGRLRVQLTVPVPPIEIGPAAIAVWDDDSIVLELPDDAFTVAPDPITLHEFDERITRDGYQASIGRDGALYLAFELTPVSAATTFVGHAEDYPFTFEPADVVMYNDQGFMMQLLDPADVGLFEIRRGTGPASDRLEYWRHEFDSYKQRHRRDDHLGVGEGPNWHRDGSRHVNHDLIIVAVRGRLTSGTSPASGPTPAFTLEIESFPDPR